MIVIKNRRAFVVIWLADFFILLGAFFVMQDRYQMVKAQLASAPPPVPAQRQQAHAVKPHRQMPAVSNGRTETPQDAYTELLQRKRMALPATSAVRNILFSYRNSKPSQVKIIGSFNDWVPQPMKKGKNHTWTIPVPLAPGDYTYNFLVDGKVIRDPNNPRTANEGRSFLTVKPKKLKTN